MLINGCIALAWLEEDDPIRAFFRVKPVAILGTECPQKVNSNEVFGDDGCLRVVPDKNEMGTFKTRMRTLGGMCLLDLRAHPRENDKIRPNKNYVLGNDQNQYMIYSDVISSVPSQIIYEVLKPDSHRVPMTRKVFMRIGDQLEGPYTKSSDNGDIESRDNGLMRRPISELQANILDTVNLEGEAVHFYVDIDHTVQQCINVPSAGAAQSAEKHAHDKAAQSEASAPPAAAPGADAPAAPPECTSAATSAAQSNTASAPNAVAAAKQPNRYSGKDVSGERAMLAMQQAGHAVRAAVMLLQAMIDAQDRLNPAIVPVSRLTGGMDARPNHMQTEIHAAADPRELDKRTAFSGRTMRLSGPDSRAYDAAKDELWRLKKFDDIAKLADNAEEPQSAASMPAATPVDEAMLALETAWSYPAARVELARQLSQIDGLCEGILNANPGAHAAASDAALIELERERLELLMELERLGRHEQDARERAFNEMVESGERDVADLLSRRAEAETALQAMHAELEHTRKECDECVLEVERQLGLPLAKRVADQAASSSLAALMDRRGANAVRSRRHVAADYRTGEAGHAAERADTAAQQPELLAPEQLIDRVSSGMYNAGWIFARDDVVNLCVCIALGEACMLTGFSGNDAERISGLLACILGVRANAGAALDVKWLGAVNQPGHEPRRVHRERGRRHSSSERSALAHHAIELSALLSYPRGVPLTPELADTGFVILRCGEVRLALPEQKSYAPIAFESFTGLISADVPPEVIEILSELRVRIAHYGHEISAGALATCLRYCAAAAALMSGGALMALDYALAQRVLPALMAGGDATFLRALPHTFKDMHRCAEMINAPLPIWA